MLAATSRFSAAERRSRSTAMTRGSFAIAPPALGTDAVAAALRASRETEALLADAASRSTDPTVVARDKNIAAPLGWDSETVPGPLAYTLSGYATDEGR